MNDAGFNRHVRRLALAWLALIVLMLASLASAYVPLGIGNAVAGLAIAALKSAIVVALFMRLAEASAMIRIVAVIAVAFWLLLAGLSGVDYATRPGEPAPFQKPAQVHTP
jgi:cytochrome c oxidase subunit 4